jgi:transglutaminase-like putative cysteine protease
MPKLASAAQVAARLGQGAKTNWEKARAIYDWVCLNIAYDTDAYFSGSHGEADNVNYLSHI